MGVRDAAGSVWPQPRERPPEGALASSVADASGLRLVSFGPEMTRTVGLNRHCSQLNSLLATFYMNLSLQKQTHLVDGRPQVSSNSMIPCFCGSKPQIFVWLRAGRAREGLCLDHVLLQRMSHSGHSRAGPWWVPHQSLNKPCEWGLHCSYGWRKPAGPPPLTGCLEGSGGRCEPQSLIQALSPTLAHPAVLSHQHCSRPHVGRAGLWLTSVTWEVS